MMVMTGFGNKHTIIVWLCRVASVLVVRMGFGDNLAHMRFASLMHLMLVGRECNRLQADQKDHEIKDEFSFHVTTIASRRSKIKQLHVRLSLLRLTAWRF